MKHRLLFRFAAMTVQPQGSVSASPVTGKQSRAALVLSGAVLLTIMCAGGCAAPAITPQVSRGYVVAARYDLASESGPRGGTPSQRVRSDLARLKSAGFNAVLFEVMDDSVVPEWISAARGAGLSVYCTHGDLHYFLLTGKTRGSVDIGTLVRDRIVPLFASHSDLAGVAILSGYPADRAAAVMESLDRFAIRYIVAGQAHYPGARGAKVAWLDAGALANPRVSQVERLLLEYHGEVLAGWNDGLVIDFVPDEAPASPSETRPGPALEGTPEEDRIDHAASSPRSRLFAVESLVRRASLWGPRLRGSTPKPIPPNTEHQGDPSLAKIQFVRDHRRYLFLFNQSSRPIRQRLRLTANLAGEVVARAVEIPATPDRIAGQVFPVRQSELALDLDLRPGDAALFEIF